MFKFIKYFPYILGVFIGIIFILFDKLVNPLNIILTTISVFVFFVLIFSLQLIYLNKKINYFVKTGSIDFERLTKEIDSISDASLRGLLFINLSVAYSLKDDYITALNVLERVQIKKTNEKNALIYYNNKAYYLYKIGKIGDAKEIMRDQKRLFEKYKDNIQFATIIRDTINLVGEINE